VTGDPTEVSNIRKLALSLSLVLTFLLSGSASGQPDYVKGRAAYYSNKLKGNAMACGSKYYPSKMVAAHRKLPCGTKLRVKNVANGEVVTVTVKDRGPHDEDFVLDLSRRAARRLGYVNAGSARVKAKVLD
jgi:rare lipoprotein A